MKEQDMLHDLQQPVTDLRRRFIELTEPHREALWSYAHRITGNAIDAEDLVQDTLLRAFAKLGYLGQALHVRAYLFKMATHIWIRQQMRNPAWETETMIPDDQGESPLCSFELGDILGWLIQVLPPKQRACFLLSTSFDFSNKEIAEMLQTTEGTIKSYLHRARKTLAARATQTNPTKETCLYNEVPPGVLQQYVRAFQAGDVAGLLHLIDEDASMHIMGDWEEYGKTQIKNNSLHYWSQERLERKAVYGMLDGMPVLFGLRKDASGDMVLRELMRIHHNGTSIQSIHWYYFSLDLIRYAAAELGMACITEGYQG